MTKRMSSEVSEGKVFVSFLLTLRRHSVKKQLKRAKGLFGLPAGPSLREVRAETMEACYLLAYSSAHAEVASFLNSSRAPSQGVVLLMVGQAILCQLIIKILHQ